MVWNCSPNYAPKLLLRAKNPLAIAAIYDFGRTPEGVFFYAMELLNGASVAQLVRAHGPMPTARAVHVLSQVCGSLTEAHRHGLVHRDVKPSNIQLCERGGIFDTAKLLDFGLVKEVGQESSSDATQENVILGTPSYLAPEVIRDATAISPAQDIYALGASAYYMLAGQAVFFGPRAMEVYIQHLTQAPKPFTAHGIKVPKRVAAIVMACLEKDPANRPGSAAAVRKELLALPYVWTEEDAQLWWVQHAVHPPSREPSSGRTTPLPSDKY